MALAERIVHGGLSIRPLPRIKLEEVDYGLIHSRFTPDRFPPHLAEIANETLEYLNQKEPPGMNAYSRKQKAYNRLLMLWEMMEQMKNTTGPHTVKLYERQGATEIYEVQLSIDFCERNEMSTASVIVLEPYDPNALASGIAAPIKGRMIRFEDTTQKVHFFTMNKQSVPRGNYIVRFEPPAFVYNARDHIMDLLLQDQRNYSFLVFPTPLVEVISKEQYVAERQAFIEKLKLSSDRYNQEQREAIVAIFCADDFRIRNRSGSLLPFIVHGPPGTGKTTTLVEACRLIAENMEHSRILVCTPSNTAADLFAYELIHSAGIDPSVLFRLNALTHPISELKSALKDVTLVMKNRDDVSQFGIPPFEQLIKFRIIVTTLLSSTYLTMGGMRAKFTHIIIDEAGQASELDALVPIVGLIGPETKVVLAGDPRQLGPVETLEYFRKNGITSSLIERYESNCNYHDDPRVITLLRDNYRSHRSIIELPSRLFYNNQLRVAKDAQPRDALATWKALPKQGFPILWHHVNSPEERETNGTSVMNKGEIDVVVDYIERIIAELRVPIGDIGVISPYSYHARKLRNRLEAKYGRAVLTVDTVERYQGSQRRVIIVSTVRSNEKESIGFMYSEKRFNTTITRAEELLIIIGNAKMMAKDPSWKEMLEFCRENQATIDLPSDVQPCGSNAGATGEYGGRGRLPLNKVEEESEDEEIGESSLEEESDNEDSDSDEEESEDEEEEEESDSSEGESSKDGQRRRKTAEDDEDEETD